jgi:hypothetical protein
MNCPSSVPADPHVLEKVYSCPYAISILNFSVFPTIIINDKIAKQ